jgi:molybdenum cofactor cytidylyltransferase
MQMLSITPESADIPAQAIVCHDVRNPTQRSEVLVRKGSNVTAAELADLLARGVTELHLALPGADDVGENAAALGIARAVAGSGVTVGEAQFGQTNLISNVRGMLRVDATRLDRVNALDGVLVLSAEADRPVEAGTTLGVVKCAPLFLAGASLLAVQNLGSVMQVQTFQRRRAALVAPRERLRGGAFDRAQVALSDALQWYGSSLSDVAGADASVEALSAAYRGVHDAGAELILAAGASGTDPLDVVFEGLRTAGGEVIQIGIPAEPGTACWIGRLDSTPVLGLASCELFGQPGALDLLLPRLLTGERLDQRLLRGLAPGGLLLGPSRIAPYHSAPSSPGAK